MRAGNQQLGGAAAAAYATYLAEGEPEQARLARFDDVLDRGGCASCPPTTPASTALLAGLGGRLDVDADSRALAARLAVLRDAAGTNGSLVYGRAAGRPSSTPATPSTSYGLNAAQAAATMLQPVRPASLQKDRAAVRAVRVLVENGVGTPGLVEKARDEAGRCRLPVRQRRQRLAVQRRPERACSSPTAPSRACTRRGGSRRPLGLPDSSVGARRTAGQTVADVIVILGADFTP